MEIVFNSEKDLYERLKPALKTKQQEMIRAGFKYIDEKDIWNYLKERKWVKSVDLALNEMVGDVLNTDNYLIDNYLKQQLETMPRVAHFDD